jgi:ABC-2 type transport system permease protein
MPWVDPERLGPNVLNAYVFAYFVLALPSLLLTSAIFFALATVTRSMMWTYVGVIAFMVLDVAGIALGRPEFEKVRGAVGAAGHRRLQPGDQVLDGGRAQHPHPAAGRGAAGQPPDLPDGLAWPSWRRPTAVPLRAVGRAGGRPEGGSPRPSAADPTRRRCHRSAAGPDASTRLSAWAQLVARTRLDMGQVFKSPAYFVLLVLGLANAMGSLWFATDAGRYGGVIYPVTRVLLIPLMGSFGLIPMIIAIYYAGELVWRERDRKTHEIIDATPVPDWAFVAPRPWPSAWC